MTTATTPTIMEKTLTRPLAALPIVLPLTLLDEQSTALAPLLLVPVAWLMPLAMPVLIWLQVEDGVAVATATPSSTCNQISTGIANGINQATGTSSSGANAVDCSSSSVNGNTIGKAAKGLVNVFSIIVGVVAVVMIIYGGF